MVPQVRALAGRGAEQTMSFHLDIPPFYALLRAEYAYDMRSHLDEFMPVWVFSADSVEGQAIGFDVMTNCGAMFSRLPVNSLCWLEKAPKRPLDHLELWDCFSYDGEAHAIPSLKHLRIDAMLKTKEKAPGEYLFTISWWGNTLSEDSGEGGFKRAHILKLDEGNFAALPNNRIRWYEPSFVTKPFPDRPDYLTNSHTFKAETISRWASEDSDRYFYEPESKR